MKTVVTLQQQKIKTTLLTIKKLKKGKSYGKDSSSNED